MTTILFDPANFSGKDAFEKKNTLIISKTGEIIPITPLPAKRFRNTDLWDIRKKGRTHSIYRI
jgi:hypothetical protein